jgi:hypothetical protein
MLLLQAFAVWLVLMAAEVVHGTLHTPLLGDFWARQVSVFTGLGKTTTSAEAACSRWASWS